MFNSNERNSLYEVFDAYSLKDFNKFELVIEAVEDNNEILINLNFTYHY